MRAPQTAKNAQRQHIKQTLRRLCKSDNLFLDNKVSDNMKNHICDTCKLGMELVPPGCHRCITAEVAIRNFKAHFLSILAGVANNFPPSL
jgi:hypothetical protein